VSTITSSTPPLSAYAMAQAVTENCGKFWCMISMCRRSCVFKNCFDIGINRSLSAVASHILCYCKRSALRLTIWSALGKEEIILTEAWPRGSQWRMVKPRLLRPGAREQDDILNAGFELLLYSELMEWSSDIWYKFRDR